MNEDLKHVGRQFSYTVQNVGDIVKKLSKTYHDKIDIDGKTTTFNPITDMPNVSIDGLKNPNSYIGKAFNQLTKKTIIKMKIEDNIFIQIHIYHNGEYELVKNCIKRIYCMIKIFGNEENISKYDGMVVDILLYNAPRLITSEYTKTPDEMNDISNGQFFNCTCGYAMIENDKFKICVTRKNGCLGLLTHELGHVCELDLGHFDNGEYKFPNDRLKNWKYIVRKHFDVTDDCHVGLMTEGINNGNSSIIHSIFLALETHDSKNVTKMFEHYYKQEFLHSIKMLCRLLKWFKYHSLRELVIHNRLKYNQKSLLLEYILVRCIYLMNFEKLGMIKMGCDQYKQMDDNLYITTFFSSLKNSCNIIDAILRHTKNIGIIPMEYYYNK